MASNNCPVEEPRVSVHLQEMTDQAPPSSKTLLTESGDELMQVVEDNDVENLKALLALKKKVDLNFINASGQTPLQVAVKNKSTQIIQILLENGADVGNALNQAVSEESLECVEILLKYQDQKASESTSADINIYHATPLILAAKNNSYDIVKFLLSKGYFIDDRDLHNRACECPKCESDGRLGCSLRRPQAAQPLLLRRFLKLLY